jgi:Mn2+/Fe2+ NRAMP family transporter
MLAVFQEMCARIGLVTGGGLAAAIKNKYPKEQRNCGCANIYNNYGDC